MRDATQVRTELIQNVGLRLIESRRCQRLHKPSRVDGMPVPFSRGHAGEFGGDKPRVCGPCASVGHLGRYGSPERAPESSVDRMRPGAAIPQVLAGDQPQTQFGCVSDHTGLKSPGIPASKRIGYRTPTSRSAQYQIDAGIGGQKCEAVGRVGAVKVSGPPLGRGEGFRCLLGQAGRRCGCRKEQGYQGPERRDQLHAPCLDGVPRVVVEFAGDCSTISPSTRIPIELSPFLLGSGGHDHCHGLGQSLLYGCIWLVPRPQTFQPVPHVARVGVGNER